MTHVYNLVGSKGNCGTNRLSVYGTAEEVTLVDWLKDADGPTVIDWNGDQMQLASSRIENIGRFSTMIVCSRSACYKTVHLVPAP